MNQKNIVNSIILFTLFVNPAVGMSTLLHEENIADATDERNRFNLYIPLSNWKVFEEQAKAVQSKDIQNVDYQSRIEENGIEWETQFDADNHYTPNDEDTYKLDINRFLINYYNKKTGLHTSIGRQSHANAGVVGEMDGITLKAPIGSQFLIGASAGFPVNPTKKHVIQDNKPFIFLNSKLPKLFNSFVLKPYLVIQYEDSYINRQSIGMEFSFNKRGRSLYQLMDYNTQFNAINLWLLQGEIQNKSNAQYYITLNYHRNPALKLNNALVNEVRAHSLKELTDVLSNKEIIAQAKNQSAKKYSATLGGRFPINSRFHVGADIKRHEQRFSVSNDEVNDIFSHNYRNQLSTQLVATNLTGIDDTLKIEYEHIRANNFINNTFSISEQVLLSGLYQLDFEFRMDEGQRSDGELVFTAMPRAMLSCQCAKKLIGQIEVGYESWDYSGNTEQNDQDWLYTNVSFRLEL